MPSNTVYRNVIITFAIQIKVSLSHYLYFKKRYSLVISKIRVSVMRGNLSSLRESFILMATLFFFV